MLSREAPSNHLSFRDSRQSHSIESQSEQLIS